MKYIRGPCSSVLKLRYLIGRIRRHGVNRFLYVTLANVFLLGGMPMAFAQDSSLVIEMAVGQTGRTVYRCTGSGEGRSQTVDCSGNVVEVECTGGAVVVDRNESGACFIGDGTETDSASLSGAQGEIIELLQRGE